MSAARANRFGRDMAGGVTEVITFAEARQRLKVPKIVFDALLKSRLLGNYNPSGHLSLDGVRAYER